MIYILLVQTYAWKKTSERCVKEESKYSNTRFGGLKWFKDARDSIYGAMEFV